MSVAAMRGGWARSSQFASSIRVVIEVETESDVLSAELFWKWRERIRAGDSAPSRAVERHVPARAPQVHAFDVPIFIDLEFDSDFPLLHLGRAGDFTYQVVPIQPHSWQHALDALRQRH